MNLKTGLMIAGGLAGATGLGFLMFNKGDKAGGATPESKDPTTAALTASDGENLTPEQAASSLFSPIPGSAGDTGVGISGATPGTAAAGQELQGQTLPGQAREVGPYTVVPDPQSGMEVVFETATQQPIGVLDAQGTLQPIVVDAQGNASLVQAPQAGFDPASGSAISAPMPAGQPQSQSQAQGAGRGQLQMQSQGQMQAQRGASQFAPLAAQLFADAGAASTDPVAGAGALAPQAGTSPMPTASATATAPAPAATAIGVPQAQAQAPTLAPAAAGAAANGAQQIGAYTLIPDSSGMQLVLETATQQPVGVIDQQGNMIPVTSDGAGNLTIADAALPAAQAPPQAPQVSMAPQAPLGMTGS